MTPDAVHTGTFLFTDVEGSTRLWQEYPEGMSVALAAHDDLLRQAITRHNGRVFKTMGDAFFAVFSHATDAVRAAFAAQCDLRAQDWHEVGALRVRMALHAGEAEHRGDDYFGSALNRCARLLAAGHGGQALLSRAVEELVRYSLVDGLSVRDLGSHQLKDLARPEHVFQLAHPSLASDFPPLTSLDTFRHNLPMELTTFVGRDDDVKRVKEHLTSSRMLTLSGSGGVGKTRLALHASAEALEDFQDGVWFVELADVASPDLVIPTLMATLRVREEPGVAAAATLTDFLRESCLLLILDNCEHLVDACAHAADAILRQCRDVHILVTSRESLGIPGEVTWRVPSLSLPRDVNGNTPDELAQYPSVRLFVDRATAVAPAFAVTDENADAIALICRRLDGIPLAMELAAARVRAMSPRQIAERLDDRFKLLTGGSRVALPRQQTLRALIDWSYELLADDERALLNRLSVFAGGFTLEAAEAACAKQDMEAWEVLDLLMQLVSKSLIAPDDETDHPRYHLLESLREYGHERLMEEGGTAALQRRHMEYFARLAEDAKEALSGPGQQRWMATLDLEHGNLQVALTWALDWDPPMALRTVNALSRYWRTRGHWTEGLEWHERALDGAGDLAPDDKAEALLGAGTIALDRGDHRLARALHDEGLRLYTRVEDRAGVARAKGALANTAYSLGELDAAESLHREALVTYRAIGDRRGVATTLGNLASVADMRHDTDAGDALRDELLGICHELGDMELEVHYLCDIGWMENVRGEYVRARGHLVDALAISRKLGNRYEEAHCLNTLGLVSANLGDASEARLRHEEALAIHRDVGERTGEAVSLRDLGCLAHMRGEHVLARKLHEASLATWRDLGITNQTVDSLVGLAQVALAVGDPDGSAERYGEALDTARESNSRAGSLTCIEGIVELACGSKRWALAATLLGATDALRENMGTP
ncbi:hypothetical protein CMK11_01890, partial [Candidatus Poribacteria bacterium]|nr:hypothetical protein [Candidatus Poribacteria bacterium]